MRVARARSGNETKRYLPRKAWAELSEAQKRRTDARKRAQAQQGKQQTLRSCFGGARPRT
ncbi:MAG: hypothetical protein KA712_05930 [Myxococcales bacterium]|nr:hypothetical protein [Myxococcales bacterium]